MEDQPILHVWIHPNNDLVDLTITTPVHAGHSMLVSTTTEVIHTNQKHPFLTTEHGFLPVGQIKVGMHVLRADGRIGVITRWTIVPGVMVMYNLEVAQDHTFTVGVGQWVVHNSGGDCGNTIDNSGASDNQGDRIPSGSFTQLSKGLIKKLGIDPHTFKGDIVGKGNVSQFDIYGDGNGNLFLLRKGKPMSTAIDTGFNISDFLKP